jgi:hypothetical protein
MRYWPAPRFALALRAAEWAVKLPAGGSPGTGCVAAGQAREAIAIWLAITATRTPPAQLEAGQNLTGAGNVPIAVVQDRPGARTPSGTSPWRLPWHRRCTARGPHASAHRLRGGCPRAEPLNGAQHVAGREHVNARSDD